MDTDSKPIQRRQKNKNKKNNTDVDNGLFNEISELGLLDLNENKDLESEQYNKTLLTELLTKHTMKDIAKKLNLAIGTVQRWLDLDNIPRHYTFDLLRLLNKEIDYSLYKSSEKDQFFTPNDIAIKCYDIFKDTLDVDLNEYTFIEPSAGDGSFVKILPPNTIALDIEPRYNGILKQDYLKWSPDDSAKKYIVIGNPPFGLRGHVALNFINHSYGFADYVAFILPQLFESDGKGSPRKRVIGYNLIHSEKITGLFHTPTNTRVEINGVFQIWSKHTSNDEYTINSNANDKIKVYSLSDGGTVASTRNKNMLDKCDIYIPSTCFGKDNMRIYDTFESLPNRKGYGIVFLKDKEIMVDKSRTIDWTQIAFLSTNSAYNLRTTLIINALI
jgi:hypothetical protein